MRMTLRLGFSLGVALLAGKRARRWKQTLHHGAVIYLQTTFRALKGRVEGNLSDGQVMLLVQGLQSVKQLSTVVISCNA